MVYFLLGVAIFAIGVGGLFAIQLRRARVASRSQWKDLIAQIAQVDKRGIERIAQDILTEDGNIRDDRSSRALGTEEIWSVVGGMEGLAILEHNSQVFIQMAAYVREWHPDAEIVAEELRLKAREIAYQLRKLRQAEQVGKLDGWFTIKLDSGEVVNRVPTTLD